MSIPTGLHNDWPWPLSLIPRKATAIAGPPPTDVVYSDNFNKLTNHPDVPNEGAWAVSKHPDYGFCFSAVEKGVLFSIGTFRYDYVDGYYTFPRLTIKKVK